MLCAVAFANSIEQLEIQREKAIELGADVIEIRIDGLKEIDFEKINQKLLSDHNPNVLSLRSEWNNIEIAPPLLGRKTLLKKLINLKPNYIELEYPLDMSLLGKVNLSTVPIVSMYDFEGMAKIAFNSVVSTTKNYDHDIIIKISATPNSIEDVKQLWRWAKVLNKEGIKHIIVGMGQLGQITRIKSRELNNLWMYARIDSNIGEPYIPGMLNLNYLKSAFKDDSWHLASIGYLPDSNILQGIHDKLIKISGLNGIFLNIPVKTLPELGQILLWIEDGLLDGINITSPWQLDVLNKLDHKDSSVLLMGSCNCVKITKNGLKGYNTQIEGARRSLEPFSIKRLRKVYIEGTERIARAFISVLKDTAETIVVRGKDRNKLVQLKQDFPEIVFESDSYTEEFDLVINCSKPEKGFENVILLPRKFISTAKIIFDPMSPLNKPSALISFAEQNDKISISGWDFFLNTAIASFELWVKRSIPSSVVDKSIVEGYQKSVDFGFLLNY